MGQMPFASGSQTDEQKKMQALQTIMNFNAEQARKRAANSGGSLDSQNGGDPGNASADAARAERKRRRKSRWAGGDDDKTFIPGMPTMMPPGLTKEQEEAYLCKWRDAIPLFYSIDIGNTDFLMFMYVWV